MSTLKKLLKLAAISVFVLQLNGCAVLEFIGEMSMCMAGVECFDGQVSGAEARAYSDMVWSGNQTQVQPTYHTGLNLPASSSSGSSSGSRNRCPAGTCPSTGCYNGGTCTCHRIPAGSSCGSQ